MLPAARLKIYRIKTEKTSLSCISLSTVFIILFTILSSGDFVYAQTVESDSYSLYFINIDLPSSLVRDMVVSEDLPIGLVYDANSLKITGVAANPTQTISPTNDGSQPTTITWSFGNVNNSANRDIIIQFRVLIADVSANKDGVTLLPLVSTLKWKSLNGTVRSIQDQSGPVKIVEPDLQIKRSFDHTTVSHGDEVICTLSISHSKNSHADAFDVDLNESLPSGLVYSPESMEIVSEPEGAMPEGAMDDSIAQKLCWHFDNVSQSWWGDREIQLKYKATIDGTAKRGIPLVFVADLDWKSASEGNPEAREYSNSAQSSLTIPTKPPFFTITLAAYPNPVNPGGQLNYEISYRNRGGNASQVKIETAYDPNLAFVSSDPAPDQETVNNWTIGDLAGNASGIINVSLNVNSSAADGAMLAGSSRISCDEGAMAQDSVLTKVRNRTPLLLINKTASSDLIRPGETLEYNISYQNRGDEAANNVTITDIIDSRLLFNSSQDVIPRPDKTWTDEFGTHVWWSAATLKADSFKPGSSGYININVSLPSEPARPTIDKVYNLYKIDSDEGIGKYKTLETFVVHSLYVRKKADKMAYAAGEIVNYTILYGNDLAVNADDSVVTDVLPDMEYVLAEPSPTVVKGNVLLWSIGKIPPKASGKIRLYAKVKENPSEISFKSSESISGYGYVKFDQRLNTAQKPDRLTNYVNITASYLGVPETDESFATVALSDALGTELNIIGHGSGSYSRDDEAELLSRNKTIRVKTRLKERYSRTSFALPHGRSLGYDSKWSEAQCARNRVTRASIDERYTYATRIDRDSSIELDKNGSTLVSETSFEGAGHVGMLKQSNKDSIPTPKEAPIYESQENYLGSFKVYTKFDEYGKNVNSNRSVSGSGFVSSDKRIGKNQRSYESGTGNYRIKDLIQTQTNYMDKDIGVSYGPVGYAYTRDVYVNLQDKWKEGIWSKSGQSIQKGSSSSSSSNPSSFIGEEFSQADYLKKKTAVRGQNEMMTDAEFSGKAEFNVNKNSLLERIEGVALYDEHIGKFQISRNVKISGVARFDEPHISVSKVGRMEPAGGTFVSYIITVVNDGNRALGPVYVLDLFPPGTEYVYSSLRPSEQNGSYARWTLLDLGIGASTTIELKLNMTEGAGNLVNRVRASGSYDGRWISGENYSAIQFNWLSCCPPQIWAAKTAYVDPKDKMMIHYRISLRNREKYVMAVYVTDMLPGGLIFQSSSLTPSNRSFSPDLVGWSIIDLKPGETKTIDYIAKALFSGVFVNHAYIEAHAVDGTDFIAVDVFSNVEIGGAEQSSSSSTWQPPACFGLNCTSQGAKGEWIPCDACATTEPVLQNISCPSCIPVVDDEYDIP